MENESGRKRNALPLACSLSEPDFAKRRRELAENVSGGVLKVDELEDKTATRLSFRATLNGPPDSSNW